MPEHLEQARESAQRTYDRRRARTAADTLAQIPPNRWDDRTRQIVATLATISAPSRIDEALEAFDGEPAHHLVELTPEAYDRAAVAEANERNAAADPAWNSSRCVRGHQHSTADNAYACDMLPGAGTVPRPAPRPYPQPRPRPNPDPRPRPEPHPSVHDNGDYRA